MNRLLGKISNHQLKDKKQGENASLHHCIIHNQSKQIFKYCTEETCRDGDPEIYLMSMEDREFML